VWGKRSDYGGGLEDSLLVPKRKRFIKGEGKKRGELLIFIGMLVWSWTRGFPGGPIGVRNAFFIKRELCPLKDGLQR